MKRQSLFRLTATASFWYLDAISLDPCHVRILQLKLKRRRTWHVISPVAAPAVQVRLFDSISISVNYLNPRKVNSEFDTRVRDGIIVAM